MKPETRYDTPDRRTRRALPSVWAIALTAALMIAIMAGCKGRDQETLLEPLGTEEISADRLWQRITEETDYTNYGFWPGHEGYEFGQAPHGPLHRVFVNEPLRSALPVRERMAPNGSIIVKENYTADRELTGYTVMAKVEGFAPQTGNWFWARYAPDGAAQAAGAVGSCISCHGGMRDNDYVIIHPLDQASPK